MATRPENIGIKAIELYFPSQCVDQTDLEKYLGVSAGKFTIGLGQHKMSFCDDCEDPYSMALTAVSFLLKNYSIDPVSIGRLEVGTESLLDKSKSCKSVLMQLFEPSGNTNIEGVDNINACYGGTNALFNAVNWVESSAWDGRDAIVVCSDIAMYDTPAARPTGGAGCVAMLIGPDAPLVLEPGMRGTYMRNAYDFYKPKLTSEYPIVDGQYSLACYLEALDGCYKSYQARKAVLQKGSKEEPTSGNTPLDEFDHLVFHAPVHKLVTKAYARLLYNDYLLAPGNPSFTSVPAALKELDPTKTYTDKAVENVFLKLTKEQFHERVQPSTHVPAQCGNMYTASVYSGLVSLLCMVDSKHLQGKKVGIFSYGGGMASSLFSLRVRGGVAHIAERTHLQKRLLARKTVSPEEYNEMCMLREKAYQQKGFVPKGDVDRLFPGTYYLKSVDGMWKREYAVKA